MALWLCFLIEIIAAMSLFGTRTGCCRSCSEVSIVLSFPKSAVLFAVRARSAVLFADYVLPCSLSAPWSFRSFFLFPSAWWGCGLFLAGASVVSRDEELWGILHWSQLINFGSVLVPFENVASALIVVSMWMNTVYCVFWLWNCVLTRTFWRHVFSLLRRVGFVFKWALRLQRCWKMLL